MYGTCTYATHKNAICMYVAYSMVIYDAFSFLTLILSDSPMDIGEILVDICRTGASHQCMSWFGGRVGFPDSYRRQKTANFSQILHNILNWRFLQVAPTAQEQTSHVGTYAYFLHNSSSLLYWSLETVVPYTRKNIYTICTLPQTY